MACRPGGFVSGICTRTISATSKAARLTDWRGWSICKLCIINHLDHMIYSRFIHSSDICISISSTSSPPTCFTDLGHCKACMDKHLPRIDFHPVMIHSYWQIPASQQDPHPPERCFRRARELGENVSDHINFQMDVLASMHTTFEPLRPCPQIHATSLTSSASSSVSRGQGRNKIGVIF